MASLCCLMMSEAYLNGWHAHKKYELQSLNPYNEALQFYSHNQWLSGWCARFSAVKHSQDLEHDENMGFIP